jgi:hypothetical protein
MKVEEMKRYASSNYTHQKKTTHPIIPMFFHPASIHGLGKLKVHAITPNEVCLSLLLLLSYGERRGDKRPRSAEISEH